MTITLSGGDAYHAQRLTHETWSTADSAKRQRALVSAQDVLQRFGSNLPEAAVYEQAAYMLTQEYDVSLYNKTSIGVDSISVCYGSRAAPSGVSPAAWKILTASGRFAVKGGRII